MRAFDKTWTTAKEKFCLDRLGLRVTFVPPIEAMGRPASSVPSLTVILKRRLESEGDRCAVSSGLCDNSDHSEGDDSDGEAGRE